MSKGEREIRMRTVLPACVFGAIILMSCDAAAKEEFQSTASRVSAAERPAISDNFRVASTATLSDNKIATNVASEPPGDAKPLSGGVGNPAISAQPDPRSGMGKPMTIY